MNAHGNTTGTEMFGYKVVLALLLTVAALSIGMKDLSRLQQFGSGVGSSTSDWLKAGVITREVKGASPAADYVKESPAIANGSDEFRWSGRLAAGKAIEIKGINGDIYAEPAAGNEIEVIGNKKARKSDPDSVSVQVVEHAGGVTICAIYPGDALNQINDCVPGSDQRRRNRSNNVNVENNDVRVDFTVRVPPGVEFFGRTVNGEISAKSLSSNVDSRTVNGSIKISTTGYARARTVNGEISATLGNTDWPGSLEFTTLNGEISLNLPSTLSTEIKADTFNGGIASEFPWAVVRSKSRRHFNGTIGAGGRELILKTFNGSINLRRAG